MQVAKIIAIAYMYKVEQASVLIHASNLACFCVHYLLGLDVMNLIFVPRWETSI